jgi:hypothetical protein
MQMATSKEYAYYVKGNKIAIVQKDWTFSGGQTLSQPGLNDLGSQGALLWKSPKESITGGLELQYVYSPQYMVSSNAAVDVNKFYVNGWTVIGGYLAFLRGRKSSISNWSSAPESTVTSGSSGDTGGQSLDYIVVGGSSRWNGLHKVQTAGTEGQLVTYTKVPETLPYWEDQNVDFNTSEEVYGRSGGSLYLADYFSAGDYVFISGSNDEANNGLFSVGSVSTSSTVNSSKLTLGTRYAVVNSSDATSYSTGLDNEYSASAALAAESSQSDINIYKAHRDFSYVLTDVNTLNDESDEIDLPEYLAKALVYYVKAKIAEDRGELEQKEYNMREFKRLLERNESSKVWGARRIGTDETAIK